jgi:hypothetical protein
MFEPVEVVPVCWLVPVEEAVEVAVDNVEDGVVIKQSPTLLFNV